VRRAGAAPAARAPESTLVSLDLGLGALHLTSLLRENSPVCRV
jgi:hypothetical protein